MGNLASDILFRMPKPSLYLSHTDETAHCMHLEEKLDLWYLSEVSFSLRYMNIPSVWCASHAESDICLLDKLLVGLFAPDQARQNVGRSSGSKLFANFEVEREGLHGV